MPPGPTTVMERRLTLLGRSGILILVVLLANVLCWAVAGLTFSTTDGLVNLALLAWTLGLRHGLDADHISAIDNATRHLVSLGQLPITCGLWFSLGHSTIVVLVNIAIAISVDIYDKLDTVGNIGGIVGTAISSAFLFLIAIINIFFLAKAIKARRRLTSGHAEQDDDEDTHSAAAGGGLLVRIIGPVLRTVDRPWKLYPVGVLFGLGFDTASSIALLAISALAQRGPDGEALGRARIIVLPFLFTVGMTLVDSLDSVLMLYAYASPSRSTPEGKLGLFQASVDKPESTADTDSEAQALLSPERSDSQIRYVEEASLEGIVPQLQSRVVDNKLNVMSSLSITLTALSILVALSISVIEIMGMIGENCQRCSDAAEADDGGGLEGAWWRAWATANDLSGVIGATIVGTFVVILIIYHGGRWVYIRR